MSSVPPRTLPLKRRASSVAAEQPRETLTPESWIEAATTVLVDQGIDHVRVDVLAGQLQVTRGSFYWHFRDREDLLRRVLQAWSDRSTALLTRRLETARTDPREQLRDVISLPFRGRAAARAARIELAIRAWARRDEMARLAVDASDASRIAYHGQIFEGLGFEPAEARMRGFVLYSWEVAESILHRQGSAAHRQERIAFIERLMLQPLQPGP
jgi:AcrR family transcriptional regulator